MNDVKSVVSVIKILERTIGILENCNDIGEIPDVTRKRVIEMLNKATLEIYFLNKEQVIGAPAISTVVEETVAEIVSEVQPAAETVPEESAEEILPEEPAEEIVPEEPAEETVPEEPAEETVPEEPAEENIPEEPAEETVPEEPTEEIVPEEPAEENISEEEPVDIVLEEEFVSEEETLANEEFVSEEENAVENVPKENTVSEDTIFVRDPLLDKPLFEWEIDSSEPVPETQETEKEDEISILKLQLEEERKRLEQELQDWQDEKRKRDEEIIAAKKLLESLQQQAAANQTKQQPVQQQPVQQQPVQQQPVQQQPVQQQPVQQQPVQQQPVQQQSQPVSQPNRVQQPQQPAQKEETQEAIIDRFIGTKKVLHESFETDNMVNQISTPVSSLPKAIGINDRFKFIKELFGGDSDLYNETIKTLDNIGSLVSAISYIESHFSWNKNSDSVKQLISLIRRRYM